LPSDLAIENLPLGYVAYLAASKRFHFPYRLEPVMMASMVVVGQAP
jgi:hypothetical protein